MKQLSSTTSVTGRHEKDDAPPPGPFGFGFGHGSDGDFPTEGEMTE